MSRTELVRLAVLRLGECTIAQVTAEIGRFISASSAAVQSRRDRRYRGKSLGSPRHRIVQRCLNKLYSQGRLRRVALGGYAPPLPKLHRPEKVG